MYICIYIYISLSLSLCVCDGYYSILQSQLVLFLVVIIEFEGKQNVEHAANKLSSWFTPIGIPWGRVEKRIAFGTGTLPVRR